MTCSLCPSRRRGCQRPGGAMACDLPHEAAGLYPARVLAPQGCRRMQSERSARARASTPPARTHRRFAIWAAVPMERDTDDGHDDRR